MAEPLLQATELHVRYGGIHAVRRVGHPTGGPRGITALAHATAKTVGNMRCPPYTVGCAVPTGLTLDQPYLGGEADG